MNDLQPTRPFPRTFLQHHLQILLEIVHTHQSEQVPPDEASYETCPLTLSPHNQYCYIQYQYIKAEISS